MFLLFAEPEPLEVEGEFQPSSHPNSFPHRNLNRYQLPPAREKNVARPHEFRSIHLPGSDGDFDKSKTLGGCLLLREVCTQANLSVAARCAPLLRGSGKNRLQF